ncbi:hypothetical protein ACPCAB_12145 [Streptomyces koyangensis]
MPERLCERYADGRHTLALLAAHYGLPSPPLAGPAGNSLSL